MSKAAEKAARRAAAKRTQTKKTIITVAIILAVLILITPLALFSSGAVYRMANAVTVGDETYTPADFNFYYYSSYQTIYNNLYSTYGDYVSMILDTSVPLDEQQYSEDQTWADYIKESTVANIENVSMLNAEAAAAGFTLSAEQEEELAGLISGTYAAAEAYGFSKNGYLQAVYGAGMNAAIYEANTRKAFIAETYAAQIAEGMTYTAEELDAAYQADPNAYEYVSYSIYSINGAAAEGEDADAAKAAAKAEAESIIARLAAGENFADVIYDIVDEESKSYYEDDSATRTNNAPYANVSTLPYGDWLFDAERASGDAEIFEQTYGYTVVQFIEREDNLYNSRDFRNILITAEAGEDGTVTAEAEAAALAEAQEILAQWKAGEATAESFGALADEHSDDTAVVEGGLYTNVPRNQVVTEVNNWLYDDARQTGDAEIVVSEFGCHILYYVGENAEVRTQLIEGALRTEEYNAWVSERMEGFTAQISSFGYNMAGKIA
ncbi:MAG: peptidylprolyl isomerase [Clostridia bacterium]|nr:peptidylprolyl isomerase [Clostridia bacterium]